MRVPVLVYLSLSGSNTSLLPGVRRCYVSVRVLLRGKLLHNRGVVHGGGLPIYVSPSLDVPHPI